ncbi:MAG: hypothetical protein NVS2B17_25650 [Candidatus Velthaea sp.]
MKLRRLIISCAVALAPLFAPQIAEAGTTGVISGTVIDGATKRPLAQVGVAAASPAASQKTVTDANGFFNLSNLPPDSYTVTFEKTGFGAAIVSGVTVNQDQTTPLSQTLSARLTTIGSVRTRSAQNLVSRTQTADVYEVTTKQLEAAQGGDNVHKTLYDFTQSVPGVTGGGANAQPRVRGGLATDPNFLYDDVPINDRLTGFFSTNNGYFQTTTISSVGVSNVQVYTGGFDAKYGEAAQGVFNSVVKRGTYPSYGLISTAIRGPLFGHYLQFEYGTATKNRKLSAYVAYDRANIANQFGDGNFSFPLAAQVFPGNGPGPQTTLDTVGNFHWRPNDNNDLQFLIQNGNGRFNGNYDLNGNNPVEVIPCAGVQGRWIPPPPLGSAQPAGGSGYLVTSPGVSSTGVPCVVTINGKSYNTGLQYAAVDPNGANNTYHYSAIGKLQFNHTFNDKLYGFVRLAENFNQYILDQPYDDPNYLNLLKPGAPAQSGGPGIPYSPTARDFYGDRRQQSYTGVGELTWTPNGHAQYYAGFSNEHDNLLQAYYDRSGTAGLSNPASAFDAAGNWPNEYTLANFPVIVTSAYAGTVQQTGKFVFAPSLRYDIENYDIPREAGGAYAVPIWSPKFSMAWSPRADIVVRGSYGITSNFVPATYVYNGSIDGVQAAGQYRNPYLPGAAIQPSLDHNVDLSFEKAFRDGRTSLRVSPFYHTSSNRLEVISNVARNPDGTPIVNPTTGNVTFTPGSIAKSGAITKDLGVELGLNHVVNGDGLSWFLAGTYQSYFSTSSVLNAAAISPTNRNTYITGNTVYRTPDQPPVSVSFTGNYTRGRTHVLPFVLWQCCAYYNVQGTGTSFAPDPNVHTAPGYWFANLTLSYDALKRGAHVTRIGLRGTNIFDNQKLNTYPSVNTCYGRPSTKLPAVCSPPGTVFDGNYFSFAPGTIPNTLYFFPPVSRNPRTIELFLTQQF